jgi:hypothetical protein
MVPHVNNEPEMLRNTVWTACGARVRGTDGIRTRAILGSVDAWQRDGQW